MKNLVAVRLSSYNGTTLRAEPFQFERGKKRRLCRICILLDARNFIGDKLVTNFSPRDCIQATDKTCLMEAKHEYGRLLFFPLKEECSARRVHNGTRVACKTLGMQPPHILHASLVPL